MFKNLLIGSVFLISDLAHAEPKFHYNDCVEVLRKSTRDQAAFYRQKAVGRVVKYVSYDHVTNPATYTVMMDALDDDREYDLLESELKLSTECKPLFSSDQLTNTSIVPISK